MEHEPMQQIPDKAIVERREPGYQQQLPQGAGDRENKSRTDDRNRKVYTNRGKGEISVHQFS